MLIVIPNKEEKEKTMAKKKEQITTSEELGSEFGDINASKFFELSQAAKSNDKKKNNEKRNNSAK